MEADRRDLEGLWDAHARDWEVQVGDEGDANRRLNSDPVLRDLVGDPRGADVLDAGCGTGYLSAKLAERGASVTGVDFSKEMIAIARSRYPGVRFHVDSVSVLSTLEDAAFDLIVSNYVLMDCEDLAGAMASFHRVLRPGGHAVLVFSHPCFPQGCARVAADGNHTYVWDFRYFEPTRRVDPPWHHFTSPFVWFHRPLSDYWKAFTHAGFAVVSFDEPRITPVRYDLADSPRELMSSQTRPYSVAFKLMKGDRRDPRATAG